MWCMMHGIDFDILIAAGSKYFVRRDDVVCACHGMTELNAINVGWKMFHLLMSQVKC